MACIVPTDSTLQPRVEEPLRNSRSGSSFLKYWTNLVTIKSISGSLNKVHEAVKDISDEIIEEYELDFYTRILEALVQIYKNDSKEKE